MALICANAYVTGSIDNKRKILYQIFSVPLEASAYEFFIVLKVHKVHFIAFLFN